MDKTLDELMSDVERTGQHIGLSYHPEIVSVPNRWVAGANRGQDGWLNASGNTPTAALQALIIKAKLPILLHTCPKPVDDPSW